MSNHICPSYFKVVSYSNVKTIQSQGLEMFYSSIFVYFYYCTDMIQYVFCFNFFYDGELCISVKIMSFWVEMLFYKYYFVVVHRFDSVFVII